jgi:hypothetical protein
MAKQAKMNFPPLHPGDSRRTLACGWRLAVLLLLMWTGLASAQVPREYQIKAVFLFNFAQFVEWPTNAFADKDAPLVVGILGADPFGPFLDDTVRNETARGHRLVVEHFQNVEEIKACHILYIGKSEAPKLDHTLAVLNNKPILTVSEIENAAYRGVMVRFITERNKIRLRINLEAARAADLAISSKLLRAAEVVGTTMK